MQILTLFFDALRLSTLNAFVFGAAIACTVYRYPGKWIAYQLNYLIFTCHFATKFVCESMVYPHKREKKTLRKLYRYWIVAQENRHITFRLQRCTTFFFSFFTFNHEITRNSRSTVKITFFSNALWNFNEMKFRTMNEIVLNRKHFRFSK